MVTHREGRPGSCLVALRIGSLSTACVHGNRILSQQTARLPEIGCGRRHWSVRGGGLGRDDLVTGSAPRAGAPALPPPACRELALGEVRGQLLAGDRSGFRHTFPEECGGFVPGARPSPEPRSPRAWGRGSGAITHLL